jgi:RND superfamily putative drug exporter
VPARWTQVVLRHRLPVLAAWLAVLVLGGVASSRLAPLLSNSFDVPGSDSERARRLLARDFGERPDGTFTVVFPVRHPDERLLQERLRRRVGAAVAAVPNAHLGQLRTGAGIVFIDVATPYDLQHAKAHTDALRRGLAGTPRAYVTGQPAVQHDLDPVFAGDLHRGEAIAVPLTLLVLLFVFGLSVAVLIPFAVAACSVTASFVVVWAVAHELSMVAYVRNLVELIGLGLAVDYSLLIVHRFREELWAGATVDDAVKRTMATAGRSVAFSGAAVAVGLGLLLAVPVPFIRSLGIGGLVVPLASIAVAATLQPVLLVLVGRRVLRERHEGPFWGQVARRVVRRPGRIAAAGAALLLVLAAPAVRLQLTPGSLTGLPSSVESVRGYDLLRKGLGGGIVTPTHVVIAPPAPAAAHKLVTAIAHDPETLYVASGSHPPYAVGGAQQIVVANRHDWGADETRTYVRRLRNDLIPEAGFPPGTEVVAGGAPPQGVDFLDRAYGAFPWVVAAVLALMCVVLLWAFRSVLLPLKAVILNVLSVAAAYGILAATFRHPIEAWVPIVLFATLFGLSMDYEVFIVTRIREAHDRGATDTEAVALGLERTGRIVTAAAAVMVIAFLGFAVGRIEGLRQFGVGLAAAVALDATIVRALLVPSLMAVLGRWNWWLPRVAGRG